MLVNLNCESHTTCTFFAWKPLQQMLVMVRRQYWYLCAIHTPHNIRYISHLPKILHNFDEVWLWERNIIPGPWPSMQLLLRRQWSIMRQTAGWCHASRRHPSAYNPWHRSAALSVLESLLSVDENGGWHAVCSSGRCRTAPWWSGVAVCSEPRAPCPSVFPADMLCCKRHAALACVCCAAGSWYAAVVPWFPCWTCCVCLFHKLCTI